MKIINNAVMEFNEDGYLIYSESFPGAYVRGKTCNEALAKFENEIKQYCKWAGIDIESGSQIETNVVQEKKSALNICDADSDVIFNAERKTFYGLLPRTAREMYTHTNNVTNYYVREIGIQIENLPDIYENRIQAIQRIEAVDDYLQNKVCDGSYEEQWSLSKVLKRFIWHDRIHAKAMYRMTTKVWTEGNVANSFHFENCNK